MHVMWALVCCFEKTIIIPLSAYNTMLGDVHVCMFMYYYFVIVYEAKSGFRFRIHMACYSATRSLEFIAAPQLSNDFRSIHSEHSMHHIHQHPCWRDCSWHSCSVSLLYCSSSSSIWRSVLCGHAGLYRFSRLIQVPLSRIVGRCHRGNTGVHSRLEPITSIPLKRTSWRLVRGTGPLYISLLYKTLMLCFT